MTKIAHVTLNKKMADAWMQHLALKASNWSPASPARKAELKEFIERIRNRESDTMTLTEREVQLSQSHSPVARLIQEGS